MSEPTMKLEKADMTILRQVYEANAAFEMPFLPAFRKWKRANELLKRGLLSGEGPNDPKSPVIAGGYTITAAGIEAYNASISTS